MKKTFIWIICLIFLIGIIAWVIVGAKSRAIVVEMSKIKRGEIRRILRVAGKLQMTDGGRIFSPISGKIIDLPVSNGQFISQGQMIAKFDSDFLKLAVDSAKSSLKTAKVSKEALLKNAPTDLKLSAARQTVDQMRILLDQARANKEAEDTTTTRDAYEAAKTNHQNALVALEVLERSSPTQDQVTAADQAIIVAQKSLNDAEKKLTDAIVFASQSGVLIYYSSALSTQVGVGASVSAGAQLFTIIAPENIYFAAEMEGEDLEMIALETKANVTIDAYPDDNFIGTVNLIENQTTTTSTGAQVYLVHLTLDKSEKNFRPGLSGNANFTLESKKDVLTVPIETIFEEDNQQFVYIFNKGTAEKTPITTGIEDEVKVEIRSGLSQGQKVIIGDTLKDIKDGSKVKEQR